MSGQPDEQGGGVARCGCRIGGLHRYECASIGHVDPPTPSAPTGDHGGLRAAVEVLAHELENRLIPQAWCREVAGRLRVVLAAHPEPEPAQDGEVGA